MTSRLGGTLVSLLVLGAANAQAQNLVQNPGFDGGFSGWTQAPGMVFWDANMGNSALGSAGIFMSSASPMGTNAFVAYQCIPATAGNTYDIRGSFRYASGASAIPIGSLYVTFFSDPGCLNQLLSASNFQMSGGNPPADTWLTGNYPGSLVPPAGTAALRIILLVTTQTAGSTFGYFDDIHLALSGGFFTVTPCRLEDTRVNGGALQGQESRSLQVAGACGVPLSAKSVSVNLAVTQPTAAGNVRLFPANQPNPPTVSSINYSAGQTRGNNAIVQLDPMGFIKAFAGQPVGTTVHLILDVNGYFE